MLYPTTIWYSMFTSFWMQMIYWVGILATGQAHAIALRITKFWYELSKSKVNNPPKLVLNAQIDYAILNEMVTIMKIVWAETTMVNVSTLCTIDNSEALTSFGCNNCFFLWDTRATDHICPY